MDPSIVTWTLQNEIPIPPDTNQLLVQGEYPVAAFRTHRQAAIFTTKRLIVQDAYDLSAKKIEVYSLPYSAIDMWYTQYPSTPDSRLELELWTNVGNIKVKLERGADVRRLDGLIAWAVLQSR